MIAFVAIAAAMVAVALAWIIVPLMRGTAAPGFAGEASNVAILRDQLRELEADLANGTIPREQYEQAREELERRVLEESKEAPPTHQVAYSRAGALTAVIVAGALPVAALLLYVALGNLDAFRPSAQADAAAGAPAGQHDVSPEQIAKMIKELEARLAKDPGNAEGWIVLARTYYQLKQYPNATRAYEHAIELVPGDASLLADYADALGSAQGGSLQGKPEELIARALATDPTQWKALALAGTAAFDRKDYAQAIAYWERMKATVPAGSEIAQSIDSSIAEARELGGLPAKASVAAASPAAPAIAATRGPAPNPPAAGAANATIAGTVTLAPRFSSKVSPDDVVFVFARAAEGSRMPLAILRKQVRDLPLTFTLDDSMSMSPAATLSGADQVIVGARISRTGQAIPQSGDIEGHSPPIKVGARGVAIVMDNAVP